MNRRIRFIIFIALIIGAAFALRYCSPEKFVWFATFSKYDDQPFGSKFVYQSLEDFFGEGNLVTVDSSAYKFLSGNDLSNCNYILIDNDFEMTDDSEKEILKFVENGSNVFLVSGSTYYYAMEDIYAELGFNIRYFYDSDMEKIIVENDSTKYIYNFINPNLRTESGYMFSKGVSTNYVELDDTTTATALGYVNEQYPNFMRFKYGKGYFYVLSSPYAFTNYYLFQYDNYEYISKALSYLPKQKTYWDEYYKNELYKDYVLNEKAQSPLRYVLQEPPLKAAFYVGLIGIIVFMVFSAKRKQKFIPIYEPPRNTTLDFVQTVANLYYRQSTHRKIALKKIKFFFDYVRNRFRLNTNEIDSYFIDKLAMKSGVERAEISNLIGKINYARGASSLDGNDLTELNKEIENFYKKVKSHGRKKD